MRMLLLLSALAAALVVTPAAAQATTSPELVASFVLGIEDGSTVGSMGDTGVSVMDETADGVFEGTGPDGSAFSFVVEDKDDCVFDISYNVSGTFAAGLSVDAKQLKTVTYDKLAEHDGVSDYKIVLVGGDGVVSLVDAKGGHTPTAPDSNLTSSLTAEEMQNAVAAFQADYCPAAS